MTVLVTAFVQLLSFIAFQAIMDLERLSRRARAYLGLAILSTLLTCAYSGEVGWMMSLPADALTIDNGVDWKDSKFAGFFVLYLLFQISLAIGPMYMAWLVFCLFSSELPFLQLADSLAFRIISTFTNEPRRVAHYAGFLRSIMACGTAIFFGVAASGVSLQ